MNHQSTSLRSPLRNLCVPLRLCGGTFDGLIHRGDAEDRSDYAEEI